MEKQKNNKGITLVALVITIIVLLILAGVSLNLVIGREGVLSEATKTIDKNDIATIQEEIELALAEKMIEFYEIKPEGFFTAKEYVKNELENSGIKTGNGIVTLKDTTITYETVDNSKKATGTYDEITGTVTVYGIETGGTTKKTLISQITAENYGEKVNYSATIDSTTLNNWRIFYNDGNVVTMICQDYLPNNVSLITEIGFDTSSSECPNYAVYSQNRKELISKLERTEGWSGLLTREIRKKGAIAKGAVDLETWVASWNAKGYTKLYTATTLMSDGVNGYYVGTEVNPTSEKIDLSSDTVGYADELYFLDNSYSKVYGYWLSSSSAVPVVEYNYVMDVLYNGHVSHTTSNLGLIGVRPIICLPASILGEKVGDIWNIE